MSEKTFSGLRARELKRFHRAVDEVVERVLVDKYESTRRPDDYRRYAQTCDLVRSSLRVVDILAQNTGSLFDRGDGRSNWEIYLSGLRQLFRKMPDSYLMRFVVPMFGLDDLGETISAYCGKWLDQTHAAQKSLREVERYLLNLDRGEAIAAEYGADDLELVRLYASLKTWRTKQEFDTFANDLEDLLQCSIEVFISGPIQLYLMLSPDTVLVILKSLTVGRLSEMRGGQIEYADMMKLAEWVRGLLADSETLQIGRQIVSSVAQEYVRSLRLDHDRLRAQLPERSMRESFVQRFESGALFARKGEVA